MATRMQVRLNGTLGSGDAERWSIGVNYGAAVGDGFNDQVAVQEYANDVASFLAGFATATPIKEDMGSECSITEVEVYAYIGSSLAVAQGVALVNPEVQGIGTLTAPFQTARVITLRTGQPGPRRRGRFYVPTLSPVMSPAGTSTPPAGYLTAWAAILAGIGNQWTGPDTLTLGVYSQVDDVVTSVTELRVGNVLDTQRRRRDTVPETFTSLAYTG